MRWTVIEQIPTEQEQDTTEQDSRVQQNSNVASDLKVKVNGEQTFNVDYLFELNEHVNLQLNFTTF